MRIGGQFGLDSDASDPLVIAGTVPLSSLALVPGVEQADGQIVVDVTVTDGAAGPSVAGTVDVAGGLVQYGAFRLDDLEVRAEIDDRGVTIGQARARSAGGQLRANGRLAFQQPAHDNRYRVGLQVRQLDLARLMSRQDNGAPFTALIDADVQVASDRLSVDALNLDATLTSAAVSAAGRTLGLGAPVAITMRSGVLTHTPFRLSGPDGSLALEGTIAAHDGSKPLGLSVDGEMNLNFVSSLLPDSVALAGLARVNGRVERDASGWRASGDAAVRKGRVAFVEPAVVVSDVMATLRARGQRIDVEASARVRDADVGLTGRVLIARAGADVELALTADDIPLEYPAGLRTRSSADLRLTGQSGTYRLAGEIVAHRAVFEPEDVGPALALDRLGPTPAAADGRGWWRNRVQLDVGVRLDDGLRVATSRSQLVIDGGLRVGGTMLAPETGGSLTLREGGTVRIARAELQLQVGRLYLFGDAGRSPELDVRARAKVSGVDIDLSLFGPLDDVRTELSSSSRPDLSHADLATLILTGRTTSAAASHSAAILTEELMTSAGRVLERQLGGLVMIDVSPDESLSVENAEAAQRLNIGIPLSNRLQVIYSRSLARGGLRWVVDYQPRADVHARVISDDDGSEAVEVSQRVNFDAWSRHLRPPAVRTRPRIGRITFEGASPEEETQLRARMSLAPGDEFDSFGSHDAARDAQQWLIGQGFLEATVDVHEKPAASGVDLMVHVERGPSVLIEWRGDDPGRSLRARTTDRWSSVLPREERAAGLAREIRRALQAARHFAAAVTSHVSEASAEVRVTFDVTRGPRGAGVDLQFEGNTALSHAMLAAAVPARNTAEFFALIDPAASRRLESFLQIAYGTEGFLDMRAGPVVTSFNGKGERFTVTIPIAEGDRARVTALELPDDVRSAGAAAPALELRQGEPFRSDQYRVGSRTPADLVSQRRLSRCPSHQRARASARWPRRPVPRGSRYARVHGRRADGACRPHPPAGHGGRRRDVAGRGDHRNQPRRKPRAADSDRHLPIGRSSALACRSPGGQP